MKKSEMAQNLYFVSVLTVITVFTWISLELYRTIIKKTDATKVPAEIMEPLDPEIDTQALDRLSKRKEFTSNDLVFPSITPSPTPTLQLSPAPTITLLTPIATPSSTITPSP